MAYQISAAGAQAAADERLTVESQAFTPQENPCAPGTGEITIRATVNANDLLATNKKQPFTPPMAELNFRGAIIRAFRKGLTPLGVGEMEPYLNDMFRLCSSNRDWSHLDPNNEELRELYSEACGDIANLQVYVGRMHRRGIECNAIERGLSYFADISKPGNMPVNDENHAMIRAYISGLDTDRYPDDGRIQSYDPRILEDPNMEIAVFGTIMYLTERYIKRAISNCSDRLEFDTDKLMQKITVSVMHALHALAAFEAGEGNYYPIKLELPNVLGLLSDPAVQDALMNIPDGGIMQRVYEH